MGVGKSTIGKCLAKELGYDFVDTDQYIENIHACSIHDLFKTVGEKSFRKIEKEVIREVSKKKDCVISTGGGLPCFHKNIHFINRKGISVLIRMYWSDYFSKISKLKKTRPLLDLKNKEDLIRVVSELWIDRYPIYKKAQFQIINNDDKFVVTKRLLKKLKIDKRSVKV